VAGTETVNNYGSPTKTITYIQAYQQKHSWHQLAKLTVEYYIPSTPFTFCPNNIFSQQSFSMLSSHPLSSLQRDLLTKSACFFYFWLHYIPKIIQNTDTKKDTRLVPKRWQVIK